MHPNGNTAHDPSAVATYSFPGTSHKRIEVTFDNGATVNDDVMFTFTAE